MRLNKEMINILLGMDDRSLKRALSGILPSLGIPPALLDSATGDMTGVRSMLSFLASFDDVGQAVGSMPDGELKSKLSELL